MDDIILGNKILLSKKYSVGSVFMLEMSDGMIAVIAFGRDKNSLCSQSFFYTEKTKKDVSKNAKKYFKKIQECLYQKRLDILNELDFE